MRSFEATMFIAEIIIKFPFKSKACQVYEGGCCRQVSTVVSQYGRQVGVIVRWLLLTGKYSCASDSMVDRWVLL